MEILKEEIERIEKGMEPTVVAESSMNVSATEENTNSKNKQPVNEPNDPIIENDEQTNQPNVVAESSMNFSATEENMNSKNEQPVEDPDDPIIENDEQTNQAAKCVLEIISSVMDIKRRPLTQPIWKNGRVLWTSELHERFVATLNLLGGPEVAKPSQIRECIKVDGLTTDQVKNYLQNYRQIWRSERYAAEIEDAAENEDVAEDEE